MSVTFMASFYIDPPDRRTVHAGLLTLAERVLNEQNCLRFDVLSGKDDPGQFILFHRWESRRDWQIFLNCQALFDFMDLCNSGMDDLVIKELTPHFVPAPAQGTPAHIHRR